MSSSMEPQGQLADHGPKQPALIPLSKPLSLIPVGLKEAALDSPTFRATAVHFADQVDAVERWLDGYVKSASKLAQEVVVLEGLVNSFLANSIPPSQLSEAVLDHDYTVLAMQRYGEGARDFWTHTMDGMKKTQELLIDPIRNFLNDEVRPFKEARRQLDATQKTFDSVIARFASQTKSKEPSSLREDAFQLHEARKAYLKSALDYSVIAPHLRSMLDTLLIKIFSDQWMRMRDFRETSSASFGKFSIEMDRIRDWSRDMVAGERNLKRELFLARKQLEDSAEAAARPSRELDDYATSTVPYLGSAPSAGQLKAAGDGSKQGWLFLRTMTGKPTRTVWIRRWFFVKNGIFGWLAPGHRSVGVEESEKIGVLLCSIRPAFQEERRFCFEVKTKDSTVLLQAETQTELTEWICVFEKAKQKALEEPTPMDLTGGGSATEAAFAVNPAISPEFAAKRSDGQIVSIPDDHQHERLLSPDITESPAALAPRGSFDVTTLRKTGMDRDSEPGREHLSRFRQKLDLTRKSTGSSTQSNENSNSAASAMPGGISSLISASHGAMPVGPARPSSSSGFKANATLQRSTTLAPATLVNPPAATSLSKTAVMLGVERGFDLGAVDYTGGMPSGLMANQWGSANYGHLSRLDRGEVTRQSERSDSHARPPLEKRSSDPITESEPAGLGISQESPPKKTPDASPRMLAMPSPLHRKAFSNADISPKKRPLVGSIDFPPFYPQSLKAHDAQFRMLFPNVATDDHVVLVFRASWNPDENQDLPGRVFVTMHDMYFYSNHLGFVLITGIGLSRISDIVAESGSGHDLLYLELQGRSLQEETSTITLKTFLEPLGLLQNRLRYLANNANAEDSFGLEEVLTALVKMEDDPVDTDLGLWTENDPRRKPPDVKASLRVDRSLFGGDSSGFIDDISKFQLPAQPVVYTPRNSTNLAVEKIFDISAKALFHIIFGDRSVLCQMLYRERRGHNVIQKPWAKMDIGHLSRAFDYQVEARDSIGRKTKVNITDKQTLDVLNDHLCYVVTDIKTPWHLPHAATFSMVSRLVITHMAKSTSKLAIFTAVEWTRRSTFTKMIERHAMNDLHMDALELIDLAADQVQKLGPNCTTKRAVQIFGQLGQHTEAAQVTAADLPLAVATGGRLALRQRSLWRLILETAVSVTVSAVTTMIMPCIALIRAISGAASAHRLLAFLLVMSVGLHMLSTTQGITSWWRDRSAAAYMTKLGVGPNTVMSKAVYLRDIEAISAAPIDIIQGQDTACSRMFQEIVNNGNIDAGPEVYAAKYTETSTKALARRLHGARQRMGVQRNNLLVALRVVNRVERDTIQGEFENWLVDEADKCNRIEMLLREANSTTRKDGESVDKRFQENAASVSEWYRDYCDGCKKELEHVNSVSV